MRIGYTTLRVLADAGDVEATWLLFQWLGRRPIWAERGNLRVL